MHEKEERRSVTGKAFGPKNVNRKEEQDRSQIPTTRKCFSVNSNHVRRGHLKSFENVFRTESVTDSEWTEEFNSIWMRSTLQKLCLQIDSISNIILKPTTELN
jgi:hypothetical protein